jgi:hypothetical protein
MQSEHPFWVADDAAIDNKSNSVGDLQARDQSQQGESTAARRPENHDGFAWRHFK